MMMMMMTMNMAMMNMAMITMSSWSMSASDVPMVTTREELLQQQQ
jgi:hypothetical protein